MGYGPYNLVCKQLINLLCKSYANYRDMDKFYVDAFYLQKDLDLSSKYNAFFHYSILRVNDINHLVHLTHKYLLMSLFWSNLLISFSSVGNVMLSQLYLSTSCFNLFETLCKCPSSKQLHLAIHHLKHSWYLFGIFIRP